MRELELSDPSLLSVTIMVADPPKIINKVFVTGATGLVGRALVNELISNGIAVSAIVRDEGSAQLPQTVRSVRCNLNDLSPAHEEISTSDVVLHLAARTPRSGVTSGEYEKTNVDGTTNVISECTRAEKRLVYVSTVNVELFRLGRLRDVYSETKTRAEGMVEDAVANGLDAVIIRPAYVFGNVQGTSGKLVDRILRGRIPVLPAPNRMFCPVFAGDLAKAIRLAAEKGERGSIHTIAGRCTTLKEFVADVCAANAIKPPLLVVPTWLVSIPISIMWRIRRLTRWSPPVTIDSLKTGAVFDGGVASQQLGFEYTSIQTLFDRGSTSELSGSDLI